MNIKIYKIIKLSLRLVKFFIYTVHKADDAVWYKNLSTTSLVLLDETYSNVSNSTYSYTGDWLMNPNLIISNSSGQTRVVKENSITDVFTCLSNNLILLDNGVISYTNQSELSPDNYVFQRNDLNGNLIYQVVTDCFSIGTYTNVGNRSFFVLANNDGSKTYFFGATSYSSVNYYNGNYVLNDYIWWDD